MGKFLCAGEIVFIDDLMDNGKDMMNKGTYRQLLMCVCPVEW